MPELLDRPTQQVSNILDEKQARVIALSQINLLMETCKAQLADKTNVFQRGNVIASSEINIDAASKSIQLSAYEKVIQETNRSLQSQNQPFSVSLEVKGGQHFLAVGYYQIEDATSTIQSEQLMQERSPEVALSAETYSKLSAIIAPYTRPAASQRETPIERTKRELNGVIAAIRDNVNPVNSSTNVQTPEELAQAIINYKEGKGPKPDAFCVPLSLLTYRILEHEGYKDPAILVFHPVNKYGREFQRGEDVQGHTTATIVVKGLLVDPAMHGEVKTIQPIVLDQSDKAGYSAFVNSIKPHYPEIFAKSGHVDFTLEQGEDQIKSRYLLEQGNRTGNSDYLLEAANLNPSSYYASIRAGDVYRERNAPDEAVICFLQAQNGSSNLYVANYTASVSLINNWESLTDNEKQLAMEVTLKSGSLNPGAFLPSFQFYRLARKVGNNDMYNDAYDIAASKLPPRDGPLTKEEKDYWALLGERPN